MESGRIKWFNSEKGFGFVELLDGRDVYLPYLSVPFPLQDVLKNHSITGIKIRCEVEETDQGLRASRLELADEALSAEDAWK